MAIRDTRRGLLKKALATAVAGPVVSSLEIPYVMAKGAPKAKLGVAVIGAGGMGGYSVDCACRENLVALVEIDDGRVAKALEGVKKKTKGDAPPPKVYHDYRKMLDECHKDLDAVLIATPDHHHAPAAIRAINLGKHTFVQKPLAHNIREAYELAKAAKAKKVLTQMGNQRHCGETYRRLCEYVWDQAVGNITESHTILGRNFGGNGPRPKGKPVPPGLHWDEWLGPAPRRDYHDGLHPFSWRSWRQFGTGTIGDMACHHIDAPFWALKLDQAKQFTVTCLSQSPGSEEMFPRDNVLLWEIPPRGTMPAVKVYCYDHQALKPDAMKNAEKEHNRTFGEFTLFVGDKGLIGSDSRILPETKHKETKAPAKTLPRAHGGPIEDLFHGIRNGTTPCSNFVDAAGPLTAFILTGHLAMFAGVGKKLQWDVDQMKCTNVPEVNQYARRSYRKGWEV